MHKRHERAVVIACNAPGRIATNERRSRCFCYQLCIWCDAWNNSATIATGNLQPLWQHVACTLYFLWMTSAGLLCVAGLSFMYLECYSSRHKGNLISLALRSVKVAPSTFLGNSYQNQCCENQFLPVFETLLLFHRFALNYVVNMHARMAKKRKDVFSPTLLTITTLWSYDGKWNVGRYFVALVLSLQTGQFDTMLSCRILRHSISNNQRFSISLFALKTVSLTQTEKACKKVSFLKTRHYALINSRLPVVYAY